MPLLPPLLTAALLEDQPNVGDVAAGEEVQVGGEFLCCAPSGCAEDPNTEAGEVGEPESCDGGW